MAFVIGWGNADELGGRSQEEFEADDMRLGHFVELLSLPAIEQAVGTFLEVQASNAMRDALADPQAIAASVRDDGEDGLSDELRHAIETALRQGTPVPSREFILQEATTAAHELAREWIDVRLLAWQSWGVAAGELFLTRTFWPPDDTRTAQIEEWYRQIRESLDTLTGSVALFRDDIIRFLDDLGNRVGGALQTSRRLELPDGVDLLLDDSGRFVLRARPAADVKSTFARQPAQAGQ